MRSLLRVVGATALVLLLAGTALVLVIDRIAASVVERGASQATGVAARVESAHVSFVAGRFSLAGLRLSNPEGFGEGDLVSLGALRVDVPRNLLAPSLRIPELVIEGLDLRIEQRGTSSNVGELLRGMESAAPAQPAADSGARELVIERLFVRDATAHLAVPGLAPIAVRVPEIVLRDVGARGSREQNVGEVVRRVLTAVLQAVARNRELPRQLAAELSGGLRELARTRGALDEIGRRAGESAGGAVEGLRDLLRRQSD